MTPTTHSTAVAPRPRALHPRRRAPSRRAAPGRALARLAPVAAAWLLASAPPPAAADTRLEEVEVEARAVAETTGRRDPSAFATVVPREEFAGTGEDLAQVLESTVGVQIRSYGGLGDFSTIAIRGHSAEQVQLFLDGMPINRAAGGGVDLSTLPLGHVERIEVYRGTAPARLAVANVGGAVELVSPPVGGPGDAGDRALLVEVGSFGSVRTSGLVRDALGPVGLLVAAGHDRTDGDFEFRDDNGTPKNPSDDEDVDRVNNGHDALSALLKADLPLPADLRLTLLSDSFWKDEGVPGLGSFQSAGASLETLRQLLQLRLRGEGWLGGDLDWEERVELGFQQQEFVDSLGEIGTAAQDNRDRTLTVAAVTEATLYPTDALALTGVVDLRRDVFEPRDERFDPPAGPESRRHALRAVLAPELHLLGDRLLLDAALRYLYVEDERRPFGALELAADQDRVDRRFTWKLGARGVVLEGVELRGNVSTSYRVPSFGELFGDRGTTVGNPELEPERGLSWDLGVALRAEELGPVRAARLEAVYFESRVDDVVVILQNSQRTVRFDNLSEARTRGLELTGVAALPAGFRLSGNLTLQKAENLSANPNQRGRDLPGQPRTDALGRLDWEQGPLALHGELHHLGENFLDPSNLEEIEARTLVGAGMRWRINDELTLGFDAHNLTDDRVADVAGFPLPGRTFFGSIGWRPGASGAGASSPSEAP